MEKAKYKKPAIQEVIFEAKFDSVEFDATLAGQFFEKVKNEFSEKKNIPFVAIGLDSKAFTSEQPLHIPIFQAWKPDESAVLQIGQGIVVANEFKHQSWENFLPIISKALTAYTECANPKLVTRIGVRYINSFSIPEENAVINDYFNFGLLLPKSFEKLEEFNLKFVNNISTNTGREFNVNTNFATLTSSSNTEGKLLLDIDCYYSPENILKNKEIIDICNDAHEIIYTLFESFLKDKVRDLMEKES